MKLTVSQQESISAAELAFRIGVEYDHGSSCLSNSADAAELAASAAAQVATLEASDPHMWDNFDVYTLAACIAQKISESGEVDVVRVIAELNADSCM